MLYFLSNEERQMALDEAARRQAYNEARGIAGRNGGAAKGDRALFYHKIGAAGEVAVASYLNLKNCLFKDSSPSKNSYDLPFWIDVKTRARHDYDLIVQLDEVKPAYYWLVTIENRQVNIQGWLDSESCRKPGFIKDPAGGREAYFVPKAFLKAPETFWDHVFCAESGPRKGNLVDLFTEGDDSWLDRDW